MSGIATAVFAGGSIIGLSDFFCNYCSNSVFSENDKGFKSIRELVDFVLASLNVFIDADGSGKSGLIASSKLQ